MGNARRVPERLERIERLHAPRASRATLLQELRALHEDGEGWLPGDAPDDGRAGATPGACRTKLDGERAATSGPLRRAVAASARERRS